VFLRHMRVVLPKSSMTAFCRSVRHAGVCIRPQPSRTSLARPRPPRILPACFASHLTTQHAAGRTCLKEPQGCLCCFCDFCMHVGQPQLSSKERNKTPRLTHFPHVSRSVMKFAKAGNTCTSTSELRKNFRPPLPRYKEQA